MEPSIQGQFRCRLIEPRYNEGPHKRQDSIGFEVLGHDKCKMNMSAVYQGAVKYVVEFVAGSWETDSEGTPVRIRPSATLVGVA